LFDLVWAKLGDLVGFSMCDLDLSSIERLAIYN